MATMIEGTLLKLVGRGIQVAKRPSGIEIYRLSPNHPDEVLMQLIGKSVIIEVQNNVVLSISLG